MTHPHAGINPVIDNAPSDDPERCAHIIQTPPGISAFAVVLDARINGTPVVALCGYTWVPTRDPEPLPVCQACGDRYEALVGRSRDEVTS